MRINKIFTKLNRWLKLFNFTKLKIFIYLYKHEIFKYYRKHTPLSVLIINYNLVLNYSKGILQNRHKTHSPRIPFKALDSKSSPKGW